MSTIISALPGRAVLVFPEKGETTRGGIIVPETSRRHLELAKLVSCGSSTNAEERVREREIRDSASAGWLFAVSMSSGTALYQLEFGRDGSVIDTDLDAFNWLKSVRTYSFSQLHTIMPRPEGLVFPSVFD